MDKLVYINTLLGIGLWAILNNLDPTTVDRHGVAISKIGCLALTLGAGGLVVSSVLIGFPMWVFTLLAFILSLFQQNQKSPIRWIKLFSTWACVIVLIFNIAK